MRRRERVGELSRNRQRRTSWQGALLQAGRQRLALDELEHDDDLPVHIEDVVDRRDVGVT